MLYERWRWTLRSRFAHRPYSRASLYTERQRSLASGPVTFADAAIRGVTFRRRLTAMDFAWARLGEIGIVPDYNATITQRSAAADRMLALESDGTCVGASEL